MTGDHARGPAGLPGLTDSIALAVGARTTVLAARDATSGQRVAVKLAHDEVGAARLAAEARALGAIGRHPNVVTLHRTGRADDGRDVLVLELCEGSLADRVTEHGPLPARTTIAVGVRAAGALETAHRVGVVHGDLGTHDLLVTRYHEVVVGGFGSRSDAVPTSAPGRPRRRVPTPADDVRDLADVLRSLRPAAVTGDEDPTATALDELLNRCLDPAGSAPTTPLELAQHLRAIERDAGWDPTVCRVGGVDATAGTGVGPDPEVVRRGRAAATTGLPPLGLGVADGSPRQLPSRTGSRLYLPPSGRFRELTAGWDDVPNVGPSTDGATGPTSGAAAGADHRVRGRARRRWLRRRRRRDEPGGDVARS